MNRRIDSAKLGNKFSTKTQYKIPITNVYVIAKPIELSQELSLSFKAELDEVVITFPLSSLLVNQYDISEA
jgi:hypothetical protein